MARPKDSVVKWLYQRTDGQVQWSVLEPQYQPKTMRLLAYGWRYGKISWKEADRDEDSNV